MNHQTPYRYTVTSGDRLDIVIAECVKMATENQTAVEFSFNGACVIVQSGQTFAEVDAEVRRQWEAESAAYRSSPAGKKAALEAEHRLSDAKARHSDCMRLLSDVAKSDPDEARILDWLVEYSNAADHIGVEKNYAYVISALESVGYIRNQHVGRPKEDFRIPTVMAQWIVGQALDCMYNGLPPHQITEKFVEDYHRMSA